MTKKKSKITDYEVVEGPPLEYRSARVRAVDAVEAVEEALKLYKKRIASAGGKARAKKLTKAERSQAARDAVNARWARLNKVKFDV